MIRLLLLFLFAHVAALAEQPGAGFDSANRLYEKGEYTAAAAAYEKLAASQRASPALYFNLGNACFKNGQIGRAVAAYRRAQALAPRDPDIRANLRFALGAVPGNNTRVAPLDRALKLLTLNERGFLTALSLWMCFGALALAQLKPSWKNSVSSYVTAGLIFSIFFGAWFIQGLIEHATNRKVVVTAPTAAVRFGPLEESQVSFNVRDGNELRVLGKKDRWLQVSDASNRTGWIPEGEVLRLP